MRVMAKDYVRTKNYVTKFIEMKTHLNAVSLKMQVRFLSLFDLAWGTFFSLCLPVDCQITSSDGRCHERRHGCSWKDE